MFVCVNIVNQMVFIYSVIGNVITWVAGSATPITPEAFLCTISVQLGANPEAVPLFGARQSQAGLFGENRRLLSIAKTCSTISLETELGSYSRACCLLQFRRMRE